jgi:hypothetical protein
MGLNYFSTCRFKLSNQLFNLINAIDQSRYWEDDSLSSGQQIDRLSWIPMINTLFTILSSAIWVQFTFSHRFFNTDFEV